MAWNLTGVTVNNFLFGFSYSMFYYILYKIKKIDI